LPLFSFTVDILSENIVRHHNSADCGLSGYLQHFVWLTNVRLAEGKTSYHITPARQRIKYKLAMAVYKCLHGLAPAYLADDCLAISAIGGKRHLRSARTGMLSMPRTTTTLGMRSLAVAGPVIWNSLSAALRTGTLSPLTFAWHLKAHLFGWSAARLRTIYDALYKSSHHDHQHL